ncbi:MAG: hypothetical protein JWP66_588 [Naasia sp.]|nr:hypothetical protein [Naasia sp.]
MLKVRALAAALLAAALAVGVSGCTFLGGEVLPRQYDPSDGLSADVGDLDIRNALLIEGEEGRANLLLSVINQSADDQPLAVQYESTSPDAQNGRVTVDLSIPARSTVTFGWQDTEQLVLEGIDTQAGALFPVYFVSGETEGVERQLPVLDTTLAEYSDLAPSPSPTPTPTPTPEPIPTPVAGTVPEGTDQNPDGTEPGDAVDSGTE